MSEPCEACKTIPPVVAEGYEAKGTYTELGGFKTYTTGPSDAKTGVVLVYDIFGGGQQTVQGADILASAGHVVAIPDLFKGEPFSISIFPPNTPEKQEALQTFFKTRATPFDVHTSAITTQVLPALKAKFPSVGKWAVMGYCWGGKVATLLSLAGTPFAASIQVHPAMLDAAQADNVTIPHFCLATKDEDADVAKKFGEKLKARGGGVGEKSRYEYWPAPAFHGFMAARADLKDEAIFKEYSKGYQAVTNWLAKAL